MHTSAGREHAYLRWSYGVTIVASVAGFFGAHAIANSLGASSFQAGIAACAAFLAPPAVARVLLRRRIDRRRRAVAASEGRRCPGCFYDLSGSAPRGRCPECGRSYKLDALAAVWEEVDSTQEAALKSGGD